MSDFKGKVLGVDGNWILHRIFHTQKFESADPATSMARRFVSLICADAAAVRAKTILVAFDGERVFRYLLYQHYKANRGPKGESGVYDHLGGLIEYLAFCGIPCVQKSRYEGDDILRSLAEIHEVLVVATRDKDAVQYLRPGLSLYDSSAKPNPRTYDLRNARKLLDIDPAYALDYQTLVGDSGDNVPQLVTPARARNGLELHRGLKRWLVADKAFRREMAAQAAALNLNRKLVKLVSDIPLEVKPIKFRSSSLEVTKAYLEYKSFASSTTRALF